MTLKDDNRYWLNLLRSDRCPPILGLVPFSEAQSQALSHIIHQMTCDLTSESQLEFLSNIIAAYPAVSVVWLARKAGEAYEFGTFWEYFEKQIGISIPSSRRPDLADRFRRTCQYVMSNYTHPNYVGSFKYVETFLFQAGLPLCHCKRFASLVRNVERHYGLPDPDIAESGEELCEHLKSFGEIGTVPILRRALEGPAGPLICQTALRVIFDNSYEGINPKLGEELACAFAANTNGTLRRAARLPYLRLADDLTSLEIVGPKQDPNIVDENGLRWVVNGSAYVNSSFDEFIFPVQQQSHISVELRGLRGGVTASRSFVVRLSDREQPFLLFNYESRKLYREQQGNTILLASGKHWLLHSLNSTLSTASESFAWTDGVNVLSCLELIPSSQVQLTDNNSRSWIFRATESPYLTFNGKTIVTDSGEEIHYGWQRLPDVWRPFDAENDHSSDWHLLIRVDGVDHLFELECGEVRGGMVCCSPTEGDFIKSVAPGMHSFEFAVFYGKRKQTTHHCWLWIGLKAIRPGKHLEFSSKPTNILLSDSHGFELSGNFFRHREDDFRQHTLTFSIGNTSRSFTWSRIGIFLESFEKRPGKPITPVAHKLGDTFSANLDSSRWLRIWHIPQENIELLLDGQSFQKISSGSHRPFFDIPLAQLSASNPLGGTLSLRSCGLEIKIATVIRPLVSVHTYYSCIAGIKHLNLRFSEQVNEMRVKAIDILSGKTCEFEMMAWSSSGEQVLEIEDLPAIKISNSSATSPDGSFHSLKIMVPLDGWPAGFWIFELEARRRDDNDWQSITDSQNQRIAMLIACLHGCTDAKFELYCSAFLGRSLKDYALDLADSDWYDILSNSLSIVRKGFAPEIADDFRWIEELYRESARRVGRVISQTSGEEVSKIMALASIQDDTSPLITIHTSSLFVAIPEILSLSGHHYRQIRATHPVAQALRWCGRLSSCLASVDFFRDLIFEAFANRKLTGTFPALQNFGNFGAVIQHPADGSEPRDFSKFNYERYINSTIGLISELDVQPEYDDHSILGRDHVEWALAKCTDRHRSIDHHNLGISSIITASRQFCIWIRSSLEGAETLMPLVTWNHPWIKISVTDDALLEHCVQFASVFALAARAAGAGRIDFSEVMSWLSQFSKGRSETEHALSTLAETAAELLGYYLMFWELMLRTSPHV